MLCTFNYKTISISNTSKIFVKRVLLMSDLTTLLKFKISNYANTRNKSVGGSSSMIDYSPFWETLKHSDESTYSLRKTYKISNSTLYRLRHNKALNTTTLNDLCKALSCNLQDIAIYIPSDDDQML